MSAQWSIRQHSEELLDGLLHSSRLPLNAEVLNPTHRAKIEGDGSDPPIPTPFFATEGIVAIKALEGTCASALAQCRFGEPANASIDVFKAVPSLFVHNVSEVEGLGLFKFGRANEGSPATEKLTKADFNKVFVNEYRHSINGMYSTKDDRIMHLHGSLNSTPTLRSLGLPPFIDGMREAEAIQLIQSKAIAYTAAELQQQAIDNKTAGQTVLTQGEFEASEHGQHVGSQPLWQQETLETSSPPLQFSPGSNLLAGIKVLDLTRAIAGPIASRVLAEYGADVLHISSNTSIPEVPFLPAFFNVGKHCAELDLRKEEDRAKFEELLLEVDVVIDGYRPGAFDKLGYGKDGLLRRLDQRKKGFVYVAENCYGWGGPWSHRPGFQQIADAASGMDWATGRALGKDFPVYPPFAMADYGCGAVAAVAALNALVDRATKGGSYFVTTSLVQFDVWLMRLGRYPDDVWAKKRAELLEELDRIPLSVNAPGMTIFARTTELVKRTHPQVFDRATLHRSRVESLGLDVVTSAPAVQAKFKGGWLNASRLDGDDPPVWRAVPSA